jgi:hypothetical protein
VLLSLCPRVCAFVFLPSQLREALINEKISCVKDARTVKANECLPKGVGAGLFRRRFEVAHNDRYGARLDRLKKKGMSVE